MTPPYQRTATADEVVSLVYELLDAHADTVALADAPFEDQRWAAHVDYLRALQRAGRELLARFPRPAGAPAGTPELR
jgi:hypothetical protein